MIRVGLNPARTRAALSVPPGTATELDAKAVEALIWQLAGIREAMTPGRGQGDPVPGTLVAGGQDMRWYLEPGPEAGSMQLLLLHQGLGWIGIMLDAPGIDAFVDAVAQVRVSEQLQAPP